METTNHGSRYGGRRGLFKRSSGTSSSGGSNTMVLILRVVQAILAIIVLGLTAYVADWWSGYWHAYSPDQINFLLFTAVWSLLALLYLVLSPLFFPVAAHKFGILAAEGITMLFWFAGFIALAVFLSDRLCYGAVCNAAKAATVFAAFEWVAFAVTAVLATVHVLRTRRSGSPEAAPEMKVHSTT